jgi:hypothetical protein
MSELFREREPYNENKSGTSAWFYSTIGLVALIVMGGVAYAAYYFGQKSNTNSAPDATSASSKERLTANPGNAAANTGKTLPDTEMSPEFKELAMRASDAIKRIPSLPSADEPKPGFTERKADAQKAVDEAKYKSRTARDNEVLKLLQTNLFFLGAANDFHVLGPDWSPLMEGANQCRSETLLALDSQSLSPTGRKSAEQKTCLIRKEQIEKRWGKK